MYLDKFEKFYACYINVNTDIKSRVLYNKKSLFKIKDLKKELV